jgi:hypothetical protein
MTFSVVHVLWPLILHVLLVFGALIVLRFCNMGQAAQLRLRPCLSFFSHRKEPLGPCFLVRFSSWGFFATMLARFSPRLKASVDGFGKAFFVRLEVARMLCACCVKLVLVAFRSLGGNVTKG